MLQATLRYNGMTNAKVTSTNNYFRDPQYNYNEMTITDHINYYREPLFNDNAKLSSVNTIRNPMKPSNTYVGMKIIKPQQESKGFTGLEMYSSGRNNRNVLPFVNTFEPKQYYTYL